jgi:hypothetical protein
MTLISGSQCPRFRAEKLQGDLRRRVTAISRASRVLNMSKVITCKDLGVKADLHNIINVIFT